MGYQPMYIIKGEDRTSQIASCTYDERDRKYHICFRHGPKVYSYAPQSVEIVMPKSLNPETTEVLHKGKRLLNIHSILLYQPVSLAGKVLIRFTGNETAYPFKLSELELSESCLRDGHSGTVLQYLKEIAATNDLKSEDGSVMLAAQYEKLTSVGENTVLALYLNPDGKKIAAHPTDFFIFPFGGNASQFQAVQNALTNQISIIQGPPGTGKTQTILNIIANLLLSGKSVQVVSNNNSATQNVKEKLSSKQYNLGFLVASLGSHDNKLDFIHHQLPYPSFAGWTRTHTEQAALKSEILLLTRRLSEVFERQQQLADARHRLDALNTEKLHFDQYRQERVIPFAAVEGNRRLSSQRLLSLWLDCERSALQGGFSFFWFRLKLMLVYRLIDRSGFATESGKIIDLLQELYFEAARNELSAEIDSLEQFLTQHHAQEQMRRLTDCSMQYLRSVLAQRFFAGDERQTFQTEDLWKNPSDFVREYPVTLSSTFSSRSSLPGFLFDYVIMDEASQVDLATGALALSGAKNAVIVGDLQQLSHVVPREKAQQCREIFQTYDLEPFYDSNANSLLKSLCSALPNAPQTLLREHYRCHPKIIGFCNQKFYHNQLIIMTEDHGEQDTLLLYRTAPGAHQRNQTNQREIDVIREEVLPKLSGKGDVGVITPYRNQVKALNRQELHLEADTVHKFQGREKDTIILSTVDSQVSEFSDKPDLLNVAVSRAKKQLIVVTSAEEKPADSNLRDLIAYMEYHNSAVIDSQVYSVFDYLYGQYTQTRISYLSRHRRVSQYDSENLMYGLLCDTVKEFPGLDVGIVCHVPLRALLRDLERLSEEERRYVMQEGTHVDFLLYRQIGKTPLLVIEVDGFRYHRQGTKQHERDQIKDGILMKYEIPLRRFPTNGSGEREYLRSFLQDVNSALPGESNKCRCP